MGLKTNLLGNVTGIEYGSATLDIKQLKAFVSAETIDPDDKNSTKLIDALVKTDPAKSSDETRATALKTALASLVEANEPELFKTLWQAYKKAYLHVVKAAQEEITKPGKSLDKTQLSLLKTGSVAKSNNLEIIIQADVSKINTYWPGGKAFWVDFFNTDFEFDMGKDKSKERVISNVFLAALINKNTEFALYLWNEYFKPNAKLDLLSRKTQIIKPGSEAYTDHQTVLHIAVQHQDWWKNDQPFYLNFLKDNIKNINIDELDANKHSALHVAIMHGNIVAVRKLLALNPNLSLPYHENGEPKGYVLEQALLLKQYDIASLIIYKITEKGASPEHKQLLTAVLGRTAPLDLAIQAGQFPIAIQIAEAIKSTNAVENIDEVITSIKAKDIPLVNKNQILEALGSTPLTPDQDPTASKKAAADKKPYDAENYLELKEAVEAYRATCTTKSGIVIKTDKFDENKFHHFVDAQNPTDKNTALHNAAERHDSVSIRYLMVNGASRILANKNNEYPPALYKPYSHGGVFNDYAFKLLSNNKDYELTKTEAEVAKSMLPNIKNGTDEALISLLDTNSSGLRPKVSNPGLFVKKLLRTPIGIVDDTVNIPENATYTQNTPFIHYMVAMGYPLDDLLGKLTENDRSEIAVLSDPSFHHDSIFHTAVRVGNTNAISSLATENLGIEKLKNKEGDTILHTAVRANQLDVVSFLLLETKLGNYHFHPDTKNDNQQSAEDLAKKLNLKVISEAFYSHKNCPMKPEHSIFWHPKTVWGLADTSTKLILAFMAVSVALAVGSLVAYGVAVHEFDVSPNPADWFKNGGSGRGVDYSFDGPTKVLTHGYNAAAEAAPAPDLAVRKGPGLGL